MQPRFARLAVVVGRAWNVQSSECSESSLASAGGPRKSLVVEVGGSESRNESRSRWYVGGGACERRRSSTSSADSNSDWRGGRICAVCDDVDSPGGHQPREMSIGSFYAHSR